MAYSNFSPQKVQQQFGLSTTENINVFEDVPERPVSEWLRNFLAEWGDAALAMNTEKARSEMIIAPILMETVRAAGHRVRLFSGIAFDVDRTQGLNGACDYLLAQSPERFFPGHPILIVVEAKKEDIPGGLGQCIATMVAAQLSNQREGHASTTVYGVVTTGSIWRFLTLQAATVHIDCQEYYLREVGKILGILYTIINPSRGNRPC